MPAFDSRAFEKRLVEAGMPVKQANTLADEQTTLLEEYLASKDDLERVRVVLQAGIERLDLRIEQLRQETKAEFAQLRQAIQPESSRVRLETTAANQHLLLATDAKIDHLRMEMLALEQRLTIKLGGIMALLLGIMTAFLKLS